MALKDIMEEFSDSYNDIKPYLTLFNIIKFAIFFPIACFTVIYSILIAIFLFGYAHQLFQFMVNGDFNVFEANVNHENYMHNFSVLGIFIYTYFIFNFGTRIIMTVLKNIF
jgi:ABC-type phosphate transport system permease subunit